uniref:uncharacterized protein LOC117608910 n=1 Tax=Osmia lignaria TaxID=473952 RepID=UPI00147871FF|nr:uncharacterized protein LOC117608910 [Osmia lignaria]
MELGHKTSTINNSSINSVSVHVISEERRERIRLCNVGGSLHPCKTDLMKRNSFPCTLRRHRLANTCPRRILSIKKKSCPSSHDIGRRRTLKPELANSTSLQMLA